MCIERYRDLPVGEFQNAHALRSMLHSTKYKGWWTYTPHAEAPMRFIRPNGEVIEPPEFYTDLGSIPPIFRIGRLMQPDSFPAVALVHDWLVRLNNCDQSKHSFEESIRIQQEALKTWMETYPEDRSILVFYLTRFGLRTRRSRRIWCHKFESCPPSLDEVHTARRSL